jgi:hypothetical protein
LRRTTDPDFTIARCAAAGVDAMLRTRALTLILRTLIILVFVPATALAQAVSGIIAGVAKDATGAVIPGVTVEAASPALIERVRTTVTDTQGEYKLVDLRPGIYTVTFTITGFNTVRRQDVEVTANVTANVNAQLRVGAIEETVTVSGQAPLVDVQNTNQNRTLSSTLVENLPTSKQVFQMAVLVPGVTMVGNGSGATVSQDVGGSVGDKLPMLSVHGSNANEMPFLYDGMKYSAVWSAGGGSAGVWVINSATIDQVAINTSGAAADSEVSGALVNAIPKQGGNRFTGYFLANYGGADIYEANNIDSALSDRGATQYVTNVLIDINPAFGGPIKKDKLWFFGSVRYWGTTDSPPGAHAELNIRSPLYAPDPNVTPQNRSRVTAENLRLTWQTSRNSKLAIYGDTLDRCTCAAQLSSSVALNASTGLYTPVNHLFQATWNWVASNRILVEAGETYMPQDWAYRATPGSDSTIPSITDQGRGITYNAPGQALREQDSKAQNGKLIMSFVTGSHNLRVGTQWYSGDRYFKTLVNNNYTEQFLNGVPRQLTLQNTPLVEHEAVRLNLGIFAQEQWTLKRLTANLGLRFDHLNAYIPAQNQPPVPLAPQYGPRNFPEYDDLPNWYDLSPRFGVSFDLFGNGKTALKFNLSRFVEGWGVGLAQLVNPIAAASNASTTRSWTDSDGNFIPNCDLTNPAANGECGANSNQSFGLPILTTHFDPSAITGWGSRPYNWENMIGIQHQLIDGLSVDVSYNRRWYGNFLATSNQAVTAADFTQYSVTTPIDPRLPDGGGQQISGLYDVVPAKFGKVDELITSASKFGNMTLIYNGLDVNVTARMPHNLMFQGGTSTGRLALNDCGVLLGHPEVDGAGTGFISPRTAFSPLASPTVPRTTAFCDIEPPFITQVKFLGNVPLPWWGLQTSVAFQSVLAPQEQSGAYPGILGSLTFTNAQIAPSLGRTLSAGAGSVVNTQIVPPGTIYGDRLNQLDFRLTKNIVSGRVRLQPQFDLYNLLNSNAVLSLNTTYGTAWQRPIAIEPGRLIKVGMQLNF